MKKSSKLKWIKWGKVWVFEGTTAVAVGNKEGLYSVFANKRDVQIGKSGELDFKDSSGYMGAFGTRKEAADLVKETDQAMSSKGEVTSIVITGPAASEGDPVEAFIQKDPKAGGTLLFHRKKDVVGRIHESCHYLLDHPKKKTSTSLREEKEAVKCQIRWHKLRKEYTPEVRAQIVSYLASYFRDKKERARIRKAERFVKEVEV